MRSNVTVLCLFVGFVSTVRAQESAWTLDGFVETGVFGGSAEQSWLSGATGRFRSGSGDDDVIAQGSLAVQFAPNLQSGLRIEAAYYSDTNDQAGITQAFWHFKPLPQGKLRARYRVGAFHLPTSFEHEEPMWQSRYTVSPSMINTWVGEELRVIGAEGRWSWRPSRSSRHKLTVLAGGFGANDPAGAMLSWRGWAAHDRQALLGETVPMAPLLAIQPGAPFQSQAPEFEPFLELDDEIGYYAGLDWQHANGTNVRYLYYDNRGDPLVCEDGQYAWDTRFHHLGVRATPAEHWQIVGQLMFGNTIMGPRAVDNDFFSASVLATRRFGDQRITARIETFEVVDEDFLVDIDPNDEDGERLTVTYAWRFGEHWTATVEASRIRSNRAYRALLGQSEKITEDQAVLFARFQF